MATDNVLEVIAAALRAQGFAAWHEHTAVMLVADTAVLPNGAWMIGNDNATWSAQLTDATGNYADVELQTAIPATSTDGATIAAQLAALITNR